MAYNTIKDFAWKIDNEGLAYAAFEYGLTSDDIPDGEPDSSRLKLLWDQFQDVYPVYSEIQDILDRAIEEENAE